MWIFLPLILLPWINVIDLGLARALYPFATTPTMQFLFDWGPHLANLTALIAFFALFFPKNLYKKECLAVVLTLVLGAGLLVNVLLKDHWGRPRPRQVTEFGGTQVFRPFYSPNFFHQTEPCRSFPSGHAANGFFFFAPALAARRHNYTKTAAACFVLALTLGGALSYTRMAQGGHFFSDVLAAAYIMWGMSLLSLYLVDKVFNKNVLRKQKQRR
ncbi:MAG: phosphatase PAP2 family protein [Chlamydiia bacterium]|nr:phosphatase PAP2 family protein [Chlamydiia bacterium]